MGHQHCDSHGCSIHGAHHHGASACSCSSGSSCGCGCSNCGCHSSSCGCSCCGGEEGDFAHQLIQMADQAWMEVLKDKIKQEIVKTNGSHLDQLAKLVSEANNERWKLKMSKQKAKGGFHERISEFFNK